MKELLLGSCLLLGATAASAVEYRVQAIETPVTFFAYEINNAGTIVGRFDGGNGATIQNGVVSQLPFYQSNMVSAHGINNQGDVVGTFRDSNGRQHGAIFRNGQYEVIESLNDGSLWLKDINNAGEAIGGMFWQSSGQTKLIHYANGSLLNLGLYGGMSVEADAINDQGQIVGYSYENGNQVPLLFENGVMTALPTFGGRWNYASGINNSGTIVGYSGFSSDPNVTDGKAVIWQNGQLTNLGTFGGPYSYCSDINERNQVVGASMVNQSLKRAFLYENGILQSINSLLEPGSSGWDISHAPSINDNGMIVGYGRFNNGLQRLVVLTPVPEPASILALSIGTVGCLFKRKRKSLTQP